LWRAASGSPRPGRRCRAGGPATRRSPLAPGAEWREGAVSLRVLFAGGGTGGHLTPALAIAEELRRRDPAVEVLLVGTGRAVDRRLLPDSGFPHRFLEAPFLYRVSPWRNATVPFRFGRALGEARRIVTEFRPHVAVGTGGYVSAPVLVAARLAGIPVALQEQNAAPGITNRWLGRIADEVYLNFPESRAFFPERARVLVTGNPITINGRPPDRQALRARWGIDEGRGTWMVMGGSQGARRLNEVVVELLRRHGPGFPYNLFFQTGREHHAEVLRGLGGTPPRGVLVQPFFTPMKEVYPLLDLIVSRAGAMTLSELTCWGIPAVLVPYPHATDRHQERNARAMAEDQAAVWLPESELTVETLGEKVELLMEDHGIRESIAERARRRGRREAAREIADRIERLAARPPARRGAATQRAAGVGAAAPEEDGP
ncbi:MAG: undecaprenyldiphospho-muramoylpentapeptide beta-N-acetylglucosaminyltransferase, partial [Gemmatimonadota bacterium]